MTLTWEWLLLVAMAAASAPQIPPVGAFSLLSGRYIDDDQTSDWSTDNEINEPSVSSMQPCPDLCFCYSRSCSLAGTSNSLLTVNCSGKGIIGFPASLPSGTQVLDMSHNKLINITSLPILLDLRVLDMSSNWMRLLDNQWVFEHVSKLRVLRFVDNGLTSLQHGSFSGLSELRELDLSKNIIRGIEMHSFSGLSNLEVLNLQNNQLYQLKREWFLPLTSLTTLYLGNNFVAKLDVNMFSKLSRLHHLDLSYNSLRHITDEALSGLGNLKLLNLSGNSNLRNVPCKALQPFSSLNILLLDGLAMSRLQPFGISSVDVIEISLSFLPKLRVVEKSAFHNLTSLRTLQLHDNPNLVFLHPSAFSSLPLLRMLFIHNNGLVAVSSQIITSLPALTSLHIHHNPLHCDCNIYWLRKEISRAYQQDYKNKLMVDSNANLPASNFTTDSYSTFSSSSSSTIATPNSSYNNISITRTFITEPDRVSCFFPSAKSSMPLIQLPIQYFSPTCPPTTLPLFSASINISLGDELWLECQGLGVPTPSISWILPGSVEVNLKNASHLIQNNKSTKISVAVVEESLLYIQSVKLSDSGSYGCRAVNLLGEDFSTTKIHVQNKPITLYEVVISNDFITVSLKGSIPRIQMSDFQLFYRDISTLVILNNIVDSTENDSKQLFGYATGLENEKKYDVIFLHSSVHRCTINGLKPQTTYEVCLMYKQKHPVECHNYTTTLDVHVVRADGIMKINKVHIAVGVASVLGVLLLAILVIVVRKFRHRKEYQDPLAEEEKTSIPLEGLSNIVPSTPLTTSRTALLIHSQI